MPSLNREQGKRAVQRFRLFVQVAAFLVTLFGSFALVRSMGLPKWLFTATVIAGGLFFCGWMCPFGTVQEWLRAVGKRLGVTIAIPRRIDKYLLFSRYLLVGIVLALAVSSLDARRTFILTMAGASAEVAAYVVLGVFLLLAVAMDRPFCRYLCGFGAVTGITTVFRIFTFKRDAAKCVDCKQCDNACMMGVEVSGAHAVRDPHCINCGQCITACPVPGALKPALSLPCRADLAALARKYKKDEAA